MIKVFSGALLICFCLGMYACSDKAKAKTDEKQQIFESLLANEHKALKNGYYMIIPVEGCEHCMPQAIAFSKKYLNSDKINFIVTAETGAKRIMKDYSGLELQSPNVINDYGSEFIRNKFATVLLTLIKVTDGVMGEPEIVEPEKVEHRLKELDEELARN